MAPFPAPLVNFPTSKSNTLPKSNDTPPAVEKSNPSFLPNGPAPKINLGKPQTFELKNGLKVLVVENHKLPKVTASLIHPLF